MCKLGYKHGHAVLGENPLLPVIKRITNWSNHNRTCIDLRDECSVETASLNVGVRHDYRSGRQVKQLDDLVSAAGDEVESHVSAHLSPFIDHRETGKDVYRRSIYIGAVISACPEFAPLKRVMRQLRQKQNSTPLLKNTSNMVFDIPKLAIQHCRSLYGYPTHSSGVKVEHGSVLSQQVKDSHS